MNYNPLIEALLDHSVIRATKYVSRTKVIRATRIRFSKKIDKRGPISIVFTIGKPNYLERDFIKQCKKAGEPFPVKKIQLKFYNSPKKKLKRNK